MNNSNVGWYYDDSTIHSYRVEGILAGTTILQIRDSAGKMGQVVVTVRDPDLSEVSNFILSIDMNWYAILQRTLSGVGISSTEDRE
jgi:hypothetical protein